MSTSQGGSSGGATASGSGTGRGGGAGATAGRGGGRGGNKGKGRAGGNSRNAHPNPNPNHRVRRAADYTPVQQPLADPARIAEATRLAVEREQERQEREREERAAAVAAATAASAASSQSQADAGREVAAITGGGAGPTTLLDPSAGGLQASEIAQDGEEDGEEDEEEAEAEAEEEFCYICAEPVRYWVLGTCNHRTCHVCSLRLRALYKKRECTFCKLDLPTVLCTTDAKSTFQSFPPDAFPFSDAKLGIAFQSPEMMEDTLSLLRFNCPELHCDYLATGWPDLKKHVRQAHDRVFCDLCTKNKKIFAHEHSLYTQHGLTDHIKHGDLANSSSEDHESTGFSGHPMCEFCRITFYGNDELFTHCRDRHEQCHICVRNGTGRYQYYVDYPHLENHFQAAHYLCLNTRCLEQRFVVMDNELDLQAHQLSEHGTVGTGGGAGGASGKGARRIETNFSYAQPTHDPRAGGGVQMRPRSTRDAPAASAAAPQALRQPVVVAPEPVAGSSNGVMGSRGRTVPGLQRGGFNTSLSSDTTASSGKKADKRPARNGDGADESVTGVKQTEPMMAARHASLLTRVSEAVGGSETRLASFRAAVRAFRNSESSAEDMIKTVHSLLDNQTDVTARIVHSTAELLDKEDKRTELLRAWDRQQASLLQSVDLFPSLVPTHPVSNFASLSASNSRSASPLPGGRQIGLAKTAKKQTTSAAGIWARVEDAASNKNVGAVPGLTARASVARNDKFPALPSARHAVSSHAVRGATPWASSRSQATSPGSTYFPVASAAAASLLGPSAASGSGSASGTRSPAVNNRPSGSAGSSNGASTSGAAPGASAFPSLPFAQQAKIRAAQKAALFGRKDAPASAASPWGPAPSPPPLSSYEAEAAQLEKALQQSLQDLQVDGESSSAGGNGSGSAVGSGTLAADGASGGKKKKKGKQLLMHYGL